MNTREKLPVEQFKGSGYEKLLNEFFYFDFDNQGNNVQSTKPNAKYNRRLLAAKLEELADTCEYVFGGTWKIQNEVLVPTGAVFSVNHFIKFVNNAKRNLPGMFKE